jgi:CheY-like chemotaxis protein
MFPLLVVDDEPAVRALVARLAQPAGFIVREAGSAGEALDRMAECPSSAVLCDISMPDRDGLWLASQLRRQFPDTALVMMTGLSEGRLEAGPENGAMASLSKPFTQDQLIGVLERAREWHLGRVGPAVKKTARRSSSPL